MKLSIIIPVLNEAAILGARLERVRRQAPEAELLVVDGGSKDGSPTLAAPFGRVLSSAPGRASQMNAGAREAHGEWLLFLHADTLLPDGFDAAIQAADREGRRVGVFRLRIDGRHPLLGLLSAGANLRTGLRRIFLGDQAMFIRRDFFLALEGFPEQPLLEDYEFSRLLKKRREPIYFSPMRVETSGRRWDQQGFLPTWWQMRRIYWRYHRRGSPVEVARGYSNIR